MDPPQYGEVGPLTRAGASRTVIVPGDDAVSLDDALAFL